MSKTGTRGRPWVVLERPRPAAVADVEMFWTFPPPELSERCHYWLRQIDAGWRPNRRWRAEGYYTRAEMLGVYLWEYVNVILPVLYPGNDENAPPSEEDGAIRL